MCALLLSGVLSGCATVAHAPVPSPPSSSATASSLEEAAQQARRAARLADSPARTRLLLDCVAIAWNGSIEAIRALHGSLPLLRRAKRIVLLMGARRSAPAVVPAPEFAPEAWFRRHDLAVDFGLLDDDADEGGPIHEAARAARADLLVMGAYGRSRFAERILGGVTRYMLQQTDLPLLLRH